MNFQKLSKVSAGMIVSCLIAVPFALAADFEFNTDVLDIQDRENMDLSQFSRAGYIMPGDYMLAIKVNGYSLGEHTVLYRTLKDAELPQPLLNEDVVAQFGLKPAYLKRLHWLPDGGLAFDSLPGMTVKADLGQSALNITVPQIYLEYVSANWDPPSRWDNGVAGMLLDYSLNAGVTRDNRYGERRSLTGSGTAGANWGAWRLRADWQLRDLLADNNNYRSNGKGLYWSRYYLYRALPDWKARLTLGEDYLTSDIFDTFRFAGASLVSDISMLPPSLRGYAPEVNGVAESNATVVVSQQGRVLYQTQVAPGPFSIQDLDSSVSGTLDVEIREQDGRVNRYQVSTASLPYLTRPGAVRYKLFTGRPTDWQHVVEGPLFTAAEVSWGVTNGWSLYGGGIGGDDYQSLALGVGRDLYRLGAISSDITVARSRLTATDTRQGKSWRVSYAKMFEEYNSQVTFAGYRFSEEDFYSMAEFLSTRKGYGNYSGNSKERYDITFNQRFADSGVSAYLTYTHQSYWNRPASDRFELSLNSYFDIFDVKNISVSGRAYRQNYYGRSDDGVSLSLSLPLGKNGTVSYTGNQSKDYHTQSLGYSGRTEDNDSYNVRATTGRKDSELSGFWNQKGDRGDLSLSATGSTSSRLAANMGLAGGMTLTAHGAALHGAGGNGGTRLIVDTDGVADVPLKGAGRSSRTNRQGVAVLTGVSSYNRSHASVALDKLRDDIEAADSVAQFTLTEGAIGYRRLDVVAGQKGLATLRLQDGKAPPFGATVLTLKGKQAGMVGDDGLTWLSGMKAGETLRVQWDGAVRCEIALPDQIAVAEETVLLLPCLVSGAAVKSEPS
ncbi:fimbria/pilus outer membrane usher protein [Pantoea sp. LS15]|uniref:fimbria/pilus outer membrane usher protein n=1 Tax=Enterobacterales TaxID=91347 RepID=UPI000E0F3226|nr:MULTISPECIES: fimbria/pilus outer membrane usher protein [Enterobacterales]NJQ21810.1 fimbria/pilus outer membrane usher protein [Pantoea sp. LS15]NKF48406.1 fimbria/pilus outer membrane usher protein [Pantoea sp. LS15]RDK12964.1 PapC/FimD family outer membrane usher protein [Enterobacter sp. 9-2]